MLSYYMFYESVTRREKFEWKSVKEKIYMFQVNFCGSGGKSVVFYVVLILPPLTKTLLLLSKYYNLKTLNKIEDGILQCCI